MSMKYYVYISDAKVDMLYSQIPKNMLDKIAVELGINLGIFSLTAKGKGNQEESRYEKLSVVVNYIENNMDVGTIDQPKTYFKGSLPMRWGPLWPGGHEEAKNLIYFGAETAETIVGLGGSEHHVIGNQKGESSPNSGKSLLPFMELALRKELDMSLITQRHHDDFNDRNRQEEIIFAGVVGATRSMKGAPQHLEFLAKRLLEGSHEAYKPEFLGKTIHLMKNGEPVEPSEEYEKSYHVVLGSPLYVAMVD
jgi:hypothetical protein